MDLRVTGRNIYGHHLVAQFDVIVTDTTAPEWVLVPSSSMQVEYTGTFSFTLEATDLSGIVSYQINDYWNFSLDVTGEINQIEDLPLGNYSLEVRAYDPYDNFVSSERTIRMTTLLAKHSSFQSWTRLRPISISNRTSPQPQMIKYRFNGIQPMTTQENMISFEMVLYSKLDLGPDCLVSICHSGSLHLEYTTSQSSCMTLVEILQLTL